MPSKKHYLIGASGHAKVILEILQASGQDVAGLFDANPAIKTLFQYPVLGDIEPDKIDALSDYIISIGDNCIRQRISKKLPCTWGNAIHPSAQVSPSVAIGGGNAIMAGAMINADTKIGSHVIINTGSVIDHDCLVENFVHISPGASLGGNVSVGEGTHVGIGSSVIQGVKIGKWAVIGAGSAIIRNVPDFAVVVGVPGKIIKYKMVN